MLSLPFLQVKSIFVWTNAVVNGPIIQMSLARGTISSPVWQIITKSGGVRKKWSSNILFQLNSTLVLKKQQTGT